MVKTNKGGYHYNTACDINYYFYNGLFLILKYLKKINKNLVKESFYHYILKESFEWHIDYRRKRGENVF